MKVWGRCPAQGGGTPPCPVWGAVSCLGGHPQPPSGCGGAPTPRTGFLHAAQHPLPAPLVTGQGCPPCGAARGASRARSCPQLGVSPALCPRDKLSPPPATLAPCLQLLFLPGLPTGTGVSRCPGVSSFPAVSPVPARLSLPTALRHPGQRCFSPASSWDGARGSRYFALAEALGLAGPGSCAGKRARRGRRFAVPVAAPESPSRALCSGRALLSLTHPERAQGQREGSAAPCTLGTAFPSPQTLLLALPVLTPSCRGLQGTHCPWEPRLCRHLRGPADPAVLPGRAESGAAGAEQGWAVPVPLGAASPGRPPWAARSRWVSSEAIPAQPGTAGRRSLRALWAAIGAAALGTSRLCPPFLWAG